MYTLLHNMFVGIHIVWLSYCTCTVTMYNTVVVVTLCVHTCTAGLCIWLHQRYFCVCMYVCMNVCMYMYNMWPKNLAVYSLTA